METLDIVHQLQQIINENKALNEDQKIAIKLAIQILKKPESKIDYIKALEILLRILSIGSNFFDK